MMKLSELSHLFMTIFLHTFATFMVIPAITDVTMAALCPGRDECSIAIYLSGFQQARFEKQRSERDQMEKLATKTHLWFTFFLYKFATFLTFPVMVDVTMSAICPGKIQCAFAIYLLGFQQAIIGLGSLVMMPLIGNLSDKYGRKALLTVPMILTIIPLAILAYSRRRTFFYAYYVLKILTAMLGDGSVHCLALAYVADNVPEGRRASAFGILSGIGSFAFVCGTLSTRFLSIASTFQVATAVAMISTIYMRIFLRDSIVNDNLSIPIMPKGKLDNIINSEEESDKNMQMFRTLPSIEDMLALLKSSMTFSQAAIVSFFSNLADVGLHASLLYYLKARFHFNKDQFADLMVICGVAGTISQLLLMPTLAPVLGEERLLSIGLFFNCAHMIFYSIAWSAWVPYAAALLSLFFVFSQPCIRSIVSKQVGPFEQGKAQGFISGLSSFANVASPLVFSPLTALFLSEGAPFHFPGFSIMCVGFASMIAFFQSLMIRAVPPISSQRAEDV